MPVTQRQSETGNRKKFGHKHHRLSTSSSSNSTDRYGKSERNGLLLLSTKKSPNAAGGLLSSKPSLVSSNKKKPLPNLNLQNQSTASTHQVLLSAVVGASQVSSEVHSQPDAWGVADKQHVSVSLETAQMEENNKPVVETKEANNNNNSNPDNGNYHHNFPVEGGNSPPTRYEMEASWDEYGGRGVQKSGKQLEEQQYTYTSSQQRALERGDIRREQEENRVAEQRTKAAQRLQELDEKSSGQGGRGSVGERKLWEPDGEKNTQNRSTLQATTESPPEGAKEELIHLSSYEDRDRGMRNGSSAPRMLFDPKSGSMVEVKARDESANAKRKERKPRHRNRDAKAETTPTESKKNGRKLKGRKDSVSSEKSENEKKSKSSSARLPRTCGVLYARSEHGTIVCKDECEGDLGYGCHSVPGGRVVNAEGYQKFVDEHAEIFQKHKEMLEGYHVGTANEPSENSGLILETGFNLKEPPQVLEWVKADDKIELVTGADDSPTLKPTAPEWAPSQAALAAAAAAAAAKDMIRSDVSIEESVETDGDEVEEEMDDEDDVHSGLGFDPMEFINSPSHLPHPEDAIASVDLKALTLEPPAFSSGDNSNAKTNIFGFGSSTWGTSGAIDQGVLGWGNTGASSDNGTTGGLFGNDVFRSTVDEKPSTLLTMPPTSTHSWGSSPIPGLNLDSTDG